MRGVRRMLAVASVLALAAAGCGGEGSGSGAEGGGGRLSIATGGTSGVYFVYGGGLAKVISSNLDGYRATAETTSASVDNLILIKDGRSDIAFTLGDTALDAVQGREAFKEKVPLRALAQIYDNYTQVVAEKGSGIETIDDLKGKRVSVGSPNSGTEVIADRVLEAAGIDGRKGIKRQQLGVEESVQAMKDGSIDAFFWSGGLPTGAVTDLTTSKDITLLDTTEFTSALKDKYGEVYADGNIPAGTYEGVDKDVPTIVVPNYLVVNESMDEDVAFDLHQAALRPQEGPRRGAPGGQAARPAQGPPGDPADRAAPGSAAVLR
jgi:TRAP transporter TAXI family solute receptor